MHAVKFVTYLVIFLGFALIAPIAVTSPVPSKSALPHLDGWDSLIYAARGSYRDAAPDGPLKRGLGMRLAGLAYGAYTAKQAAYNSPVNFARMGMENAEKALRAIGESPAKAAELKTAQKHHESTVEGHVGAQRRRDQLVASAKQGLRVDLVRAGGITEEVAKTQWKKIRDEEFQR